jgi:hypothetical protein
MGVGEARRFGDKGGKEVWRVGEARRCVGRVEEVRR